jgi:hypothetical protein
VLPHLDATVVYELTEYGHDLDNIVFRLGLWGVRSLGDYPGPDDVFTLDSAVLSLYTIFQAEAAIGVRVNYELHMGPNVVHALIDDGALKVAEGPHPDADLIIETAGSLKPMFAGNITPRQAIDTGLVRLTGNADLLDRFVSVFHIPPAPQRTQGIAVL